MMNPCSNGAGADVPDPQLADAPAMDPPALKFIIGSTRAHLVRNAVNAHVSNGGG